MPVDGDTGDCQCRGERGGKYEGENGSMDHRVERVLEDLQ